MKTFSMQLIQNHYQHSYWSLVIVYDGLFSVVVVMVQQDQTTRLSIACRDHRCSSNIYNAFSVADGFFNVITG